MKFLASMRLVIECLSLLYPGVNSALSSVSIFSASLDRDAFPAHYLHSGCDVKISKVALLEATLKID